MATNRDNEHLGTLQDYYAKYHVIPSYAAIGELVGIASKSAVSKLVARLRLQQFLEQSPDGRLVPAARFFERQVVGVAPAGFASPAADLMGDALTIDDYLVEHPAATVIVRAKGNSMINAGINDGDFLIIERKTDAPVGSIVVAIVDGDFTIKYLQRDRNGYYLQPANPEFSDIRPEGSLEIYGVMTGLFRKV